MINVYTESKLFHGCNRLQTLVPGKFFPLSNPVTTALRTVLANGGCKS